MTLCSNSEVRRCRPFLGTYVEISATGLTQARLCRAIEAAFEAIERVQRLMSAHDPSSELSRVNEEAFLQAVTVSQETFEVLGRGIELSRESAGSFDFTVAPLLARWGLLPLRLRRNGRGNWLNVQLLPRRRVRFDKPLSIDLGGIAKGFAVDAAVAKLRQSKVPSGLVNAGGDLRVFGPRSSLIRLRHPNQQRLLTRSLRIRNAALATSSPCFTERRMHGRSVSHLVNPRDGSAITGGISVTVRADECWLADALTKVVLNRPLLAEELLARHAAEAFVFEI